MAVTALAFSNAQNGYLASASADTTAKIWDPLQGLLIKTLEGHTKVRKLSLLRCFRYLPGLRSHQGLCGNCSQIAHIPSRSYTALLCLHHCSVQKPLAQLLCHFQPHLSSIASRNFEAATRRGSPT